MARVGRSAPAAVRVGGALPTAVVQSRARGRPESREDRSSELIGVGTLALAHNRRCRRVLDLAEMVRRAVVEHERAVGSDVGTRGHEAVEHAEVDEGKQRQVDVYPHGRNHKLLGQHWFPGG